MRGVQVDAIPYDMNEMADFVQPMILSSANFTWDGTGTSTRDVLENFAFAPIVIYNPDSVNLQLLITVEYRVRFPFSNPAQASHKLYPPSSDSLWARAIGLMQTLGHGAMDIAEAVGSVTMARAVMAVPELLAA